MRLRRTIACGLGLLALAAAAGCGSAPAELEATPVDRVLVVSLPGLDWDGAKRADMPNLDEFTANAAVADLATRIGRRPTTTTDAYLTLGAGTRAIAPKVDTAVAVDADETYGGVPASELVERRLGRETPGIAYLAIGPAIDANEHSPFGAEVGSLGDRLAKAGVSRAVVANADAVEGFVSDDPPPDGAYARGAATMLMDSHGIVPGGTVSRSLLTDDRSAAFGWRLDRTKAVDAFDDAWNSPGRSVVVVEASDMSRVAAYGARANAHQRAALRSQALDDADTLLGDLMKHVDPAHDAVLVLSPVSPGASPALGVVALQAPGVDGGLLQSATTRRNGYVQLADVAPTVLELLGEKAPDTMEGRSFGVSDRDNQGVTRLTALAESGDAAAFRDATMFLAVTGIVVGLALLALGIALRSRLSPKVSRLLAPCAYGALGVVPASFIVGQVGAVRASLLPTAVVVLLVAAVFAALATAVDRRRPGTGALVAVGSIVALIALDILVGAPLQLNTTFGYSVAVAGRFTGLGNLAFALFGAATIVLAALIVDRWGRQGLVPAVILLAGVVVVEGLPMMGADVGGVLAMVPAFGVTALVLAGRRVGWRQVAALVGATVVVLLLFAFVDAARPAEVQTHLARIGEHIVGARWDTLGKSLSRRWQASLGGAELAAWITVGVVMAGALAYAALAAMGRAGPGATRAITHRPTLAAAAGLAVLGTVGLVANDSSVAVPFTMLIVVAPVVMLRVLRA